MNYEDLQDGQKVNVYIPLMNNFYQMNVHKDLEGSYTVSNYGSSMRNRIGGHEVAYVIRHQKDVDGFFYMHKEPIGFGEKLDEATQKAEAHFKKNNRNWIF